MRKSTKVVNLATALGALAASAAAPATANIAKSDEARIADEATIKDESKTKAEAKLSRGEELMSFTVRRSSDGVIAPQHSSHASSSGSYGSDDDSY